MSLLSELKKIADMDIAKYVARLAKNMGYSKERAIGEAASWQEKRINGYHVTATRGGIHASKPMDESTRHLWEDIT